MEESDSDADRTPIPMSDLRPLEECVLANANIGKRRHAGRDYIPIVVFQ
jgi:hypothetical protein